MGGRRRPPAAPPTSRRGAWRPTRRPSEAEDWGLEATRRAVDLPGQATLHGTRLAPSHTYLDGITL